MKKISFFIVVVIIGFMSFGLAQTSKMLAVTFMTEKTKVYSVDSVALFNFIENKEAEMKIESFFKTRNMPMYKNAAKFIEVANKNGYKEKDLPIYTLAVISILESTGGKRDIGKNPFGWKTGKLKFSSYDEAIEFIGDAFINAKYFKNKKSLEDKLFTYNSVNERYQKEFFDFLNKIKNQKIQPIDTARYIDSFKVEILTPKTGEGVL